MNVGKLGLAALVLMQISTVSHGARTGALGLNYTVGPSFIIGEGDAQDAGTVEPGVATALQFRLHPNIDFLLAYDYLHADLRTQAITFNGQFNLRPADSLSPFFGAGMGFGKPFSGEGWDHFSMKLNAGVEKSLTADFSLAGLMTYQFVDGTGPIGMVHSLTPGIRLIYYFAKLNK